MSLSVDIEKKLGAFQLKIKFDVDNETLALFGASGCGKSVTLRCIAGIVKPDRGRIVLNDKVLFDSEKHINLSPQKRNVGYLFQQYALFPNMTVEQNIACGNHRNKSRERVSEMIKTMHLDGLEKKHPSQLSGGQQQRTALARILISEPDILMLDEPFSALDTHLRYQMEHEVRSVIKRFGKSVLLVSHDSAEVYRLSDRIAVINDGVIESLGTREEIYLNPGTVNGAILTGYRNVSGIEVLDENKIYAGDWGAELSTAGITDGAKHAAFRTESVRLGGEDNTIECIVEAIIPNAFANAYRVIPKNGNPEAGFVLDVKEDHPEITAGSEILVSVPKEEIVLLRD